MAKIYRFGKEERIRKPSEFKFVLSTGRRILTHHFAFYVHRKDDRVKRLGISISRRVGGAAQRNRIKRLLRESFRLHKNGLPEGVDVVAIVRKTEGIRNLESVNEEFQRVLDSFSGDDDA